MLKILLTKIQKNKNDYWFDKNSMNLLKVELKKRKKNYDKLCEKYETSKKYPDRYSTYYFNIIYDIVDLCVIFKFTHINRSHPFSSDGWSSLSLIKVCHLNRWDYYKNET